MGILDDTAVDPLDDLFDFIPDSDSGCSGKENIKREDFNISTEVKDDVLNELRGLGFNFRLKSNSNTLYISKCPQKHTENDRTKVSLIFGTHNAFVNCKASSCQYSAFTLPYKKQWASQSSSASPLALAPQETEIMKGGGEEEIYQKDLKEIIEDLRARGAEHLSLEIVPDFLEDYFKKVLISFGDNKRSVQDLLLQNFLSFGGFLACHFVTLKDILYGGETEPMLYFISFSNSTGGKSFAEKKIWRGCKDFIGEKSAEYHDKLVDFEERLLAYRNSQKNTLSEKFKRPKKPMDYKVFTGDFTVQSLKDVVVDSSPIIIASYSEAGAFLEGFGMNEQQITKTITTLSNMWSDGADYSSRARKAEKSSRPGFFLRLNINFLCQHAYADKFLRNGKTIQQGLIGRFLIKNHKEYENSARRKIILCPIKDKDFFGFYKKTLEEKYKEFEADFLRRSIVVPSYLDLNFSELARDYYLKNIDVLNEKKMDIFTRKKNETLFIFYNRYSELFTRICGALHFLHRFKETEPIQTETVKRAFLVMNFYELSVLELYGANEEDRQEQEENEYFKKIIERCLKRYRCGFSKRDFYRLNSHRHAELKEYFQDLLSRGEIYEEKKGIYKFSETIKGRFKK